MYRPHVTQKLLPHKRGVVAEAQTQKRAEMIKVDRGTQKNVEYGLAQGSSERDILFTCQKLHILDV